MIKGWEQRDASAIMACFSEGAVWHNMPMSPIEGRAAIAAAVNGFLNGVEYAFFEVHNQWEVSGKVVVNERTDRFRRMDGKEINIPVMGIFEVQNDLIVAWRDYFDMATMNI
jgi:limonene-1,2-epoxide hydrolase